MKIELHERLSQMQASSSIFAVNGTNGDERGITALIDLMGKHGLPFYQSEISTRNQGPAGLFNANDTIIIKVNGQWNERGGTNTDLIKSILEAIVRHPDRFNGEIIIADNGQGTGRGATGSGGSFTWPDNNAMDTSQSIQKVVNSLCCSSNISTYLWDNIAFKRVSEYSDGDEEDGYVIDMVSNPRTGVMVSYPKFKTEFGTFISFKEGVWNPDTKSYYSSKLKIINMPTLKSHSSFGATCCTKHYMGVCTDRLTEELGTRTHDTVGTGGMGTEIARTRPPTLNIADAIWINANPGEGPRTTYDIALEASIISASTDPISLDYWAAKHILIPAAHNKGYNNTTSMDPDNTAPHSMGRWLRLSMDELNRAGCQATTSEDHTNIYVTSV